MSLAVGAFETLTQAEDAVRALIDSGFVPEALSAATRHPRPIMLAGQVPARPAAEPVQLLDQSERAAAAALAGAIALAIVTAAALLVLPRFGVTLGSPVPYLIGGRLAFFLAVALGAALGAALGSFLVPAAGLPHDLAVRYTRRLEQGDVLVGVKGPRRQVQAARETLAMHGAVQANVMPRGSLAPVAEAEVLTVSMPSLN